MHDLMLAEIIKNCRQRIADGDHTTTKANPVEHLEEAVAQLADARDAQLRTLATAMRKFAPDLSAALSSRWMDAKGVEEAFLRFMREPSASSACPICGVDTPHHHTAAEIAAGKQ